MSNGARWVGTVAVVGFVGVILFVSHQGEKEVDERNRAEQVALKKAEAERRARRQPEKPKPTLPMDRLAFRKELVSSLAETAMDAADKWLSVEDYDTDGIRMVYRFPEGEAPNPGIVEIKMTVVVVRAVKLLMAAGWNPRERNTTIRCRGEQPAPKSITGGDRVLLLGRARYTPYDDKIDFDADE